MRKIPATMATQHPDNALPPFWDKEKNPFIAVYKEIDDAMASFEELGASEFMWDWEGKNADAAVIDKIFSDHLDYFSKHQLNRDKFLTFRLPNIWEEKGYSLLQAMTVILTGEDFARDLGFERRPLFEVILPMTESADQLMKMHLLFEKLAKFKSKEFTTDARDNKSSIELIPLVESVQSQQAVGKLLDEYLDKYRRHYGENPEYIRPFFARSDPALVSGLLATVLANKVALSQTYRFSKEKNIPVFPISGVGSLPFRGGLAPATVGDYVKEYPGMRTVTVQSSFRYDNPEDEVKKAISKLEKELPKTQPVIIDETIEQELINIGKKAEKIYQKTLTQIAPDLGSTFAAVPKRRERRQHVGLLAYGRKLGEQKMPRAITFTAGFYSLGVPPELIGTGRAASELTPGELDNVMSNYKMIKRDLEKAIRYLNEDNLNQLAENNSAWAGIQKDMALIRDIFDIKTVPSSPEEIKHQELTGKILGLRNGDKTKLTNAITEAAKLRKSLG